ncbi:zinc ABC transporter ATP-binding protein AztA [Rubrivivax albus]|uniref:ABC transporter ATP-binding protein n=1 Tax=Rubrivivax albus TaxID=2499835 RepID=A0A437JUT7_9BURK|nr:zinc ABC transporter ATP-binding protein AztA [Rubrivivax albus]RVT50982.1 ABC transporter ATP-binding protein [Rubrivivax albus]
MLRLHDLTLGYDRHPAVHHLGLAVEDGALLAVVGPNGAGKSTLLKGIAGLLRPMSGRIERTPSLARLAYLPQHAEVDRSFPVRVADVVAMGLWSELGPWRRLTRDHHDRVVHALEAVGLQGFGQRTLDTLSGGQFQRLLFARLMLQDARLILLDEPFAAVDEATVDTLMALVQVWHAQGRTVLAVLHDLALVRRAFPQTLLLAREAVACGPTATVLTPANLARTRGMVEAFDDHAAACDAPEATTEPPVHATAHRHDHGHGHDHGHRH